MPPDSSLNEATLLLTQNRMFSNCINWIILTFIAFAYTWKHVLKDPKYIERVIGLIKEIKRKLAYVHLLVRSMPLIPLKNCNFIYRIGYFYNFSALLSDNHEYVTCGFYKTRLIV